MIDIKVDVYADTPPGGDPDQKSATLRRYHAFLWSKPLPDGRVFSLSADTPGVYLHHRSDLGEFFLASDSICHTYRHSKLVAPVIARLPESELEEFFKHCSTIGAYTIFPGRRIDRKPTINGARGLHPKVGDRFDLTLECIRRHYSREASPLTDVLARYSDFFDLFGTFEGYVDFFLFQDLVPTAGGPIDFFLPHRDFGASPYPEDPGAYRAYRNAVTAFVASRNARIGAATYGS
jgi:hypothetical protein